jgi:hypothetical protein
MTRVTTSKALGEAIKRNESTIIIEGDLAENVIRLKMTGPIAWTIAAGAIGTAIYLYLSTPAATTFTAPAGGSGGVISFGAASGAAAVGAAAIGMNATIVAIGVGIAAGGIGAVTALRDKYRVSEKSNKRIILKLKEK